MPDISGGRGDVLGGRGRMWLSDDQEKHDPLANILVARDGRWLGYKVAQGVYDDQGSIGGGASLALVGDMNSARGAAGQDGTIGLWLDYPSGGDVQLVALNGTVEDIPNAYP